MNTKVRVTSVQVHGWLWYLTLGSMFMLHIKFEFRFRTKYQILALFRLSPSHSRGPVTLFLVMGISGLLLYNFTFEAVDTCNLLSEAVAVKPEVKKQLIFDHR